MARSVWDERGGARQARLVKVWSGGARHGRQGKARKSVER